MNLPRVVIVLGFAAAGSACNAIFNIPEASPSGGTCAAGYRLDGNACADIDECEMASSCLADAICTNTPGSFTCECPAGMVGDGTTKCLPAEFTRIEADYGSTCAIAKDGALWCWGNNSFGQLGDGTTTARAVPGRVGNQTDWIDLSASSTTMCGLRADHSAWCWGYNAYGQLGNGTQDDATTPQRVIATNGWTAIRTGDVGTCGIHEDGSLECWGRQTTTPGVTMTLTAPAPVGSDRDWKQIAVLQDGWCGLRDTPDGNLYCWGLVGFLFYSGGHRQPRISAAPAPEWTTGRLERGRHRHAYLRDQDRRLVTLVLGRKPRRPAR